MSSESNNDVGRAMAALGGSAIAYRSFGVPPAGPVDPERAAARMAAFPLLAAALPEMVEITAQSAVPAAETRAPEVPADRVMGRAADRPAEAHRGRAADRPHDRPPEHGPAWAAPAPSPSVAAPSAPASGTYVPPVHAPHVYTPTAAVPPAYAPQVYAPVAAVPPAYAPATAVPPAHAHAVYAPATAPDLPPASPSAWHGAAPTSAAASGWAAPPRPAAPPSDPRAAARAAPAAGRTSLFGVFRTLNGSTAQPERTEPRSGLQDLFGRL